MSKKITDYQKNRSIETYDRVYHTLYRMVLSDQKINFYTVAEEANVSRAYLYQQEDFYTFIKTCALTTKEGSSAMHIKEKLKEAEKRLEATHKRFVAARKELDDLLEKQDDD